MWYLNENGNSNKPSAFDYISSQIYIYIRKNFELIPATEEMPAHWSWQETKIKKEDWELYKQILAHDTALDDIYVALTELANLIVGEE